MFLVLEVMYLSLKAGENYYIWLPPISVHAVMRPIPLVCEVSDLWPIEPATPLQCEPQAPLTLPE